MGAYFSHVTTCTKITGGLGKSLLVQWLGLHVLPAEGPVSVPGWGTKIPQTEQWGQKRNKKNWEKKISGGLYWFRVSILHLRCLQLLSPFLLLIVRCFIQLLPSYSLSRQRKKSMKDTGKLSQCPPFQGTSQDPSLKHVTSY